MQSIPSILLVISSVLVISFTAWAADPLVAPAARPRLIVLADMGNENDEEQQMMHLLMVANEVDLEGLLAVSGKFLNSKQKRPYKQVLHPELFQQLIDGYEKVLPNLQLHAPGWPTAEHLRSIVATGQTDYGMGDVGEGKSTPGSKLILAAAERSDPRPLHIVVNAGANTLAQALTDYRATHSPEETRKLVAKLRVFDNQAQDDAGAWICHEFPEIEYIRSMRQTRAYGGPNDKVSGPHTWKPYPFTAEGQDQWAVEHVRTNHGALGELYPQRKGAKFWFIEGGGTIPWMRLVSPGLTDPSEPSWGGWSGRYTAKKQPGPFSNYKDVEPEEKSSMPFSTYADAGNDTWTDPDGGQFEQDKCAAVFRWRQAMWNDFQARMDWCVKPVAEANHRPVAALDGDVTDGIVRKMAAVGDTVAFDASASTDPDKDTLNYRWWIYPEAGRKPYGRKLEINNADQARIDFVVPEDAADKELHLILEVRDGSDIVPLVDYRRVVIDVTP